MITQWVYVLKIITPPPNLFGVSGKIGGLRNIFLRDKIIN